jgi:hypothetical protein
MRKVFQIRIGDSVMYKKVRFLSCHKHSAISGLAIRIRTNVFACNSIFYRQRTFGIIRRHYRPIPTRSKPAYACANASNADQRARC